MKTLLTLLTALVLLFTGLTTTSASELPPCPTEDSTNCYWDAQTMGNGLGNSFENVDGVVTYTDYTEPNPTEFDFVQASDGAYVATDYLQEYEADLTTSTEAWALWDAVGASQLLPNADTEVQFVDHNTSGFPLTADTIIVWDTAGNFYQFELS